MIHTLTTALLHVVTVQVCSLLQEDCNLVLMLHCSVRVGWLDSFIGSMTRVLCIVYYLEGSLL